ncbi:hypothetical protein Tco_0630154 [Tanacetum coccineum]
MTISELTECLRKKDSENEHLKSKIVDFTMVQNLRAQVKELQSENKHLKSKVVDCTMCQNLQMQVEKLKSVNGSLNLLVEELSRAPALAEATLRERDELISDHCKKMRLLEEQSGPFYEVPSEFDSEIVHDTKDNSEKDLILNFRSRDETTNHFFEEDKRMFLAKNEFLEKVSSSVQKEYNDLLASNDVLKQILETKFKFLKHDNSLEKMIETIEKEMGDKVKCFDDEKKVYENKISKLEKVLAQRVKDFDDVKT